MSSLVQAQFTQAGKPETWQEMTQQPDVSQWQQAVEAEKQSLDKMKVFQYCAKPPKTPISQSGYLRKS